MKTKSSAPSSALLKSVDAFLAQNGLDSTKKALAKELKQKTTTVGWNTVDLKDADKESPNLASIFEKWEQNKDDPDSENTSSSDDSEASANSDSEDSSSNESVVSEKVQKATDTLRTNKKKSKRSASSSSNSSSSSDSFESDADDEEEETKTTVKTKTPTTAIPSPSRGIKRKASSSFSSCSSSDEEDFNSKSDSSDDSSEDDGPAAKRAKREMDTADDIVMTNGVKSDVESSSNTSSSSSSSSSESGSNCGSDSDSDSDSEKVQAPAAEGSSDSGSGASSVSSSDSSSDESSDDEVVVKKTTINVDPIPRADSDSSGTVVGDKVDPASAPVRLTQVTVEKKAHRATQPTRLAQLSAMALPGEHISNEYISYDYAEKAYRDLIITRGKGFTKEKNKKKRGSYRGGTIDISGGKAFKFDD